MLLLLQQRQPLLLLKLYQALTLLAAGDWGCNSRTTDTVNNIVDKDPEIALGLGDYEYYEGNADCWFDIIQPIDDIMNIAIGDHELENSKLPQYMEHFDLTDQYYSLDYQNVHFTVMADYVSDEIGSEQYDFVKDDLAKARSRSKHRLDCSNSSFTKICFY